MSPPRKSTRERLPSPIPPPQLVAGGKPRAAGEPRTTHGVQSVNPTVIDVVRAGDDATDGRRPVTTEPIVAVRLFDPVRHEFTWFMKSPAAGFRTTRDK